MHRRTGTGAVGLVTAVVTALGVAGCGGEAGDGPGLALAASFYPLQFVSERVGGDALTVTNLTAPGAEPHDLELTPTQVASVAEADLVVYLAGFQPSVDSAVEAEASDAAFDVTPYADLSIAAEEHAEEDAAEHAEAEGEESHGDANGKDPHFWLDPLRLADVADALAERLGEIDPDNAETYATNASDLRTELEQLDRDFRAGTTTCDSRVLVTSHEAFAYLGDAYDFEQLGISGLSPDQEPSPSDLAAVSDFVEANDVKTIYYETLVSPDVANTVAAETGATTAVLDPIEGITDASAGTNYVDVMRANLASIRSGQPCQ